MKPNTKKTTTASRATAEESSRRVKEDPDCLPLEAFRGAQLGHAGLVDAALIWDALFLAATAVGIEHLEAQETIGRQFRMARIFPLNEIAEVAA